LGKDSEALASAVIDQCGPSGFTNVVLIANWGMYPSTGLRPAILQTVHALRQKGCRVSVFQQWPRARCSVPHAVARILLLGESEESFLLDQAAIQDQGLDSGFLAELTSAGVEVLDPRPLFLDERLSRYRITYNGRVLYRDTGHLTRHGAMALLAPWLDPIFFSAHGEAAFGTDFSGREK
jgi:hypothetical protein